jgi:hypothetical protein
MGVFMAEVYMYIYNWQEKKEENQALEDFCHAPPNIRLDNGQTQTGGFSQGTVGGAEQKHTSSFQRSRRVVQAGA